MGVKVIVEVLDQAPAELTPAERLILIVLAERCRDDTRRVLPAAGESVRNMVRRRTGLGDSGLRKALARLSARGFEVRMAAGIDGKGRPVFAWENSATEFVVPPMPEGGREGCLSVIHRQDERDASGTPEAGPEARRDGTTWTPLQSERQDESAALSLIPSEIPQPRARKPLPPEQAEAVASLLVRFGPNVDEDLATTAVIAVATRARTNLTGYLSRFTLEDVQRAALTRSHSKPPVERCEHGTTNGRDVNGRGAAASRICGRCEADDPASPDTAEAVS